MSGPVAALCNALQVNSSAGEYASFINNTKRRNLLRGVFAAYYSEVPANNVIFDTNRSWTGRLPLIVTLFEDARVICCVRDIGSIINSIELQLITNPLQLSRIFDSKPVLSVYTRADHLMNPQKGLIGLAWSTLREAWFGAHAKRLVVIHYDALVRDPYETIRKLYRELDEPLYEHDFNRLAYEAPEYDSQVGLPGLHTVGGKISSEARRRVIPPDIFNMYSDREFWGDVDMNPNGVAVL